jgi:glutathione synthase/RimK-type ligase-like ATP-grasp enzyme
MPANGASPGLLIAGGANDPNLESLARAAAALGVPVRDARVGAAHTPTFDWQLDGAPTLGGVALDVGGAFVRYDVFESMIDPRPAVTYRATAWYHAMMGWLAVEERVNAFNRHMTQAAGNKPATLIVARACGLPVPATWITNDVASVRSLGERAGIAKPVAGGDFCRALPAALEGVETIAGAAAAPAIVQERLVPPEVRIFIVGDHAFAFELASESLDYRVSQDVEVRLLGTEPPPEVAPLRRLMATFNMNFGAADFKSSADGALVFLELNTSPMFARFDHVSGGALARAMVNELTRA